MTANRKLLRLKSLKFCSLVDRPAQETARAILKRDDGADHFEATCRVVKTLDLGIVIGWALTSTIPGDDGQPVPYQDLQGDVVSDAELLEVAAKFAEDGGAVDEQHNGQDGAGKLLFLFPLTASIAKELNIPTATTGLLVGIKPTTAALAKFKSGEYQGFSIAGSGVREPIAAEKRDDLKTPEVPWSQKPKRKRKAKTGRTMKRAVLTSETDGHQHAIDLDDPASGWSDMLSTSCQIASGAANGHSHAWIYDENTGAITIASDSGHTHTCDGIVPPDVIAEALAEDDEEAGTADAGIVPASGERTTVTIVSARAPGSDVRDYLDGLAKTDPKGAVAAANTFVKNNHGPEVQTVQLWLVDNAAIVKAAQPVVKTTPTDPVEICKARELAVADALDTFNAELEKFQGVAKAQGTTVPDINHFMETDKGRELYRAYSKARELALCGDIGGAASPFDEKMAAIEADLTKTVEEFSIAHNLEPRDARNRLSAISSTFAKKLDEIRDLNEQRFEAIKRCTSETQVAMLESQKRQAAEEEAHGQALKRAAMLPAEKALHDRVAELAKQRGQSFDRTMTWASVHDEAVIALHRVAADERRAR